MTMIPTFLLLLALSTISVAQKADKKIIAALQCMNKTQTTEEMVKGYKPGDEKPPEELLCFIKCTFEEMGYVNEDGSVCLEAMKKDGFPARDTKVYECLDGLDAIKECEDAWALEQCFVNN